MKVIKRGEAPPKVRRLTCKVCKSELEYGPKDVKDNTDPRDNISDYYIDCPVCKAQPSVKPF